jgi:RNA polymerase sigma factor (sigma-70 family)
MDIPPDNKDNISPELSHLSPRAREDYALVLSAVHQNDQKAFAILHKNYRNAVMGILLKIVNNEDDAEDLMMESFAKAFDHIHEYRPYYAFSTWIFRIATNTGIDFVRKRRLKTMSLDRPRNGENAEKPAFEYPETGANPEELLMVKQKYNMLKHWVLELKPVYRDLIIQRFFEEKSYEEIAEEANVPIGTIKAQIFRAKKKLFKIIIEKGSNDPS